jgi:hypothetical protein
MFVSKSMTFPTPRDMVYFLKDWIVNPMLNLLNSTMTYTGFEPGTFGEAVSIPLQPIMCFLPSKFAYFF